MGLSAVIGANWGDEGKGLITDYLAGEGTLVVRFNGGAQAGHTVVTPEGKRHVFHQLGSGSFRGARTLLTRDFLVNPATFEGERRALDAKLPHPLRQYHVMVDRRAEVTTPWDMLLNRAVEEARGDAKHGSCGLGINETVTRREQGYSLTAYQLSQAGLLERLREIRDGYVPMRAKLLGVEMPSMSTAEWMLQGFLDACRFFVRESLLVDDTTVLRFSPDIVFEGAQGLRLDECSPDFPHVTRSRTGLTNVATLLREADRADELITVHYVTRAYTTRHGHGPLPYEVQGHPFGWTGAETNVENAFQGKFRYAYLNAANLKEGIDRDLQAAELPAIRRELAVTCLDQLPAVVALDTIGELQQHFLVGLLSYGPTRAAVKSGLLVCQ